MRRLLAFLACLSLAFGPAADAQFRAGRPYGLTPGLRFFNAAAVSVTTQFVTASGNVTVPSGITSARVDIWGAGGNGDSGSGFGGGGGGFSQSIISVTAGETLVGQFVANNGTTAGSVALLRSSTTLVSAQNGSNSNGSATSGGAASNGIGSVKYSGSSPGGSSQGGGAAGSKADAPHLNDGSSQSYQAGSSDTFTQSSDSTTATAGAGGQYNNGSAGNKYGGGGAYYGQQGTGLGAPGIIIIEWGRTS